MFDRLIASEAAGEDVRNRRRYFMVSSVIVSILFTTAVIISIYAEDYGLGTDSFELTEMIAPVEMAVVEPETPQPRPPVTSSQLQSQVATRQVTMARIDETPVVPTTVSVVPNTQMSRPLGDYRIDKFDSNPVNSGTSGRNTTGNGTETVGLAVNPPVVEETKEPEPPPVKVETKKPPVQSLGVINGKAEYLPKPIYSAAAIAVHAQGKVDVQVMIDETGKVIAANAVSGHVLLRPAAEKAARSAKFSPTFLSKVPVKVTGVIVYNFTR
jgi:TonB family protein